MQSEERELITGLFGRLQPFETQPRDSEAEALIKDAVARQPAAPYLLVHDWLWRPRGQSVVVSVFLLKRLNLLQA